MEKSFSRNLSDVAGTKRLQGILRLLCLGTALQAAGTTTVWYRFAGTSASAFDSTVVNAVNPGTHDGKVKQYSPSFPGKATYTDASVPPQLLRAAGETVANASSLYIGPADSVRERSDYASLPIRAYGGYVQTPASDAYKTASFTAEFVYRIDHTATANSHNYARFLINCCGGYSLRRSGASSWELVIGRNTVCTFSGGTDGAAEPGKWHHLAVTFDGATKTVSAWIDYKCVLAPTVLENELEYGVVCMSGYNPPTDMLLGNGAVNAGFCFAGWWDEFRLSDRALAVDEFLDARVRLLPAGDPANTLYRYRFGDTNTTYVTQIGLCGWALSDVNWLTVNSADPAKGLLTFKDFSTVIAPIPSNDVFYTDCRSSLTDPDGVTNAVSAVFAGTPRHWYATDIPQDAIVTNDFTVECVFRSDSAAEKNGSLIRQRPNGSVGAKWGIAIQNGLRFYYESNAEEKNILFAGTDGKTFATHDWHHAAVVYDRNAHTVSLWFDYTLCNVETLSGAINTGGNQLIIGMFAGSFEFFHGLIDEVRITQGKLSSEEFLTYPSRGATKTARTLGLWRFEGDLSNPFAPFGRSVYSGDTPVFSPEVLRTNVYDGVSMDSSARLGTNGQSLQCVGSCVDIAAAGMFSGDRFEPRAFTVEFFYRSHPDEVSGNDGRFLCSYLDAANGDSPVWAVRENRANHALCGFFRSNRANGSGDHLAAGAALDTNRWHHVAMTVAEFTTAPSTTNLSVTLYVDYARYAHWEGTGEAGTPLSYPLMYGRSGGTFCIGGSHAQAWMYRGLLDEMRLTPRVLEPSEFLRQRNDLGLFIIVR